MLHENKSHHVFEQKRVLLHVWQKDVHFVMVKQLNVQVLLDPCELSDPSDFFYHSTLINFPLSVMSKTAKQTTATTITTIGRRLQI